MTEKELRIWIEDIKEDLRKDKRYKGATEEDLNEMVMDGMFYGFQQGELKRTDLATIAKILGFEINQEFMNDPHPDPYYAKHKK